MSKKRKANIFLLTVSILSVIALSAGKVIYAYLADGDSKKNIFTVGENEIKAEETFETPQPGEKTIKEPKAVNSGSVDCYVRGKVLLSDSRAEPYLIYYNGENQGINEKDWQKGKDGWFYYQKILKVSEVSAPVFTHIFLNQEIPEEIKDVSVDVVFESVQSEGFADAGGAFAAIGGDNTEGEEGRK